MKNTKNIIKTIRFNREEMNKLEENSKKAGLNQSEYIRKRALDYMVREKPDKRFYDVMKFMRSVSISMNQIARKANSLGFVDVPAYKREAKKLDEFMREVKKEFLSQRVE